MNFNDVSDLSSNFMTLADAVNVRFNQVNIDLTNKNTGNCTLIHLHSDISPASQTFIPLIVSITDVNVILNSEDITDTASMGILLNFATNLTDIDSESANITINNFHIVSPQPKISLYSFPQAESKLVAPSESRCLLRISGFHRVSVDELVFGSDDSSLFPLATYPWILFEKIYLLFIFNLNITGKTFAISSDNTLIQVQDVTDLQLSKFTFSANNLSVQSSISSAQTTSLTVIEAFRVGALMTFDNTIENNTLQADVWISRITGDFKGKQKGRSGEHIPAETTMYIDNLKILENKHTRSSAVAQITTQSLSYVNFKDSTLGDITIKDVVISSNELSGSIISLYSRLPASRQEESQYQSPDNIKNLIITNVNITNNQKAHDLSFLDFFSIERDTNNDRCLQMIEPYTINISHLLVADNTFSEGLNYQWTKKTNLFQITQAKVILSQATISNNFMDSYNLIGLEEKPSPAEMSFLQVTKNRFKSSSILSTNSLTFKYACKNKNSEQASESQPLNRYTSILHSTFSDNYLNSSQLFFTTSRFIVINNCTFTGEQLQNSRFVLNHYPLLTTNSMDSTFLNLLQLSRTMNFQVNNRVMRRLFSEELSLRSGTYMDPYNIFLLQNTFQDIQANGSKFIHTEGFGRNQSLAIIGNNTFSSLKFDQELSNAIIEDDSIGRVVIEDNTIEEIDGKLVMFSFTAINNCRYLRVVYNRLYQVSVTSFLLFWGNNLGDAQITDNHYQHSSFNQTCIYIQTKQISNNWAFTDNRMENVTLLTDITNFKFRHLALISLFGEDGNSSLRILFNNESYYNINVKILDSYPTQKLDFIAIKSIQNVQFDDMNFQNITITTSGNLMDIDIPNEVSYNNSVFNNITTSSQNGITLLRCKSLTVYNVLFKDITNKGSGGTFFLGGIISKININFYLATFDNISSLRGSLLTFTDYNSDYDVYINMSRCFVSSSTGDQETLAFELADVHCESCVISESYFGINSKGTMISLSNGLSGVLELRDVQVSGPDNYVGPFIKMNDCDMDMELVITKFDYEGENKQFSLVYTNNGIVDISHSIFKNVRISDNALIEVRPPDEKSALYAKWSYPRISIENTTFRNIFNPVRHELPMHYFELGNNYSGSISPMMGIISTRTAILLLVKNCTFHDVSNLSIALFGSLQSHASQNRFAFVVTILESVFSNIRGPLGSVLAILPRFSSVNGSSVKVINSTFQNTDAAIGSALLVSQAQLQIENSSFITPPKMTINDSKPLNQAMIYAAKNTILKSDTITHINGAKELIMYDAVDFDLRFRNSSGSWIENQRLEVIDNIPALSISGISPEELGSSELIMSFVDKYGISVNEFVKKIEITNGTRTRAETTPMINVVLKKDINVPLIKQFQFNNSIGAVNRLNVSYSSDRMSKTKTIEIVFRDCIPGERKTNNACYACLAPSYSLTITDKCLHCPPNARTCQRTEICPHTGFWNTNISSPYLIKCRDDNVTRCNSNTTLCRSCHPGYTGPLCEACDYEEGYAESGYLTCSSHSSSILSLYQVGYVLMFFMLYQGFGI